MCDGMREPPRPGADLFTYWREQPVPDVGDVVDLPLGDWLIRVRITKVKDSEYVPDHKHVSMIVVG